MMRKCHNCAYFTRHNSEIRMINNELRDEPVPTGICRAAPPVCFPGSKGVISIWPVSRVNDYCGKHKYRRFGWFRGWVS
mgnify:CR=1 FL=1